MRYPILFAAALFAVAPAHAADFVNSIGMEFNNIPTGSFYMGSCKLTSADDAENKKRQFMGQSAREADCPSGSGNDENADDDETPQHQVQISKPFQMGVHEVTLGQFKRFIASAGRDDLLTDNFIKYNSQGDDAPVVIVSWDDAQAFIRWLNQKEGGNRYRLPTEAQWEYAARAGNATPYNFFGNFVEHMWYAANSEGHQHPVGQKPANAFGLHDMAGNVYEWVQDWYGGDYYRNTPTVDPQGPRSGESRVARGGSWNDNPGLLRSALRGYQTPGNRSTNGGFRLSRM